MRLVAIDLDGTLLDSSHQIPKENHRMLRELVGKGVIIVIATGRSIYSGQEILRELGIPGYLLALNGTYISKIVNGEEIEVLKESHLEQKVAKEAFETAFEHQVSFILTSQSGSFRVYFDKNESLVQEFQQSGRPDLHILSVEEMRTYIQNQPDKFYKMSFTDTNQKKLAELQHDLSKKKIQAIFSDTYYIEVVPDKINKGESLRYISEYLNIPMEETMAIGDQENDIEMLEYSGFGVAMGNASQKVKGVANAVTASNDDEGVAKALKEIKL